MNPLSLANASAVVNAELMSGNHVIIIDGAAAPPPPANRLGSINMGASIPTAKLIANQGMICTNSSVFSVAMFAFFEVSPIHIPNHHNAARFVPIITTAPSEIITVTHRPGPLPLTNGNPVTPVLVITTAPVLVVVEVMVVPEDVTFVTVVGGAGTGGVGMEAANSSMAPYAITVASSCVAR
jgi:hypothetical protein